ncbi:MAG TPA: phosphatidate cytidylyltransferase, partial [Candidatus Limnocylindrales bacterium]|nr:phosphatidate cytidylyltransferase [Candidatus Limnocylindrales bacterium]
MSGLRRRVVTAVLYGALVLVAVAGPWPTFVLLLLVLGAVALVELAALISRWLPPGRRVPALLAGAAYLLVGFGSLAALWAGDRATHHALPDALVARGITTLPAWLLLALLPTWAADIAAYAVGSTVGRRRLLPSVSPGKTWEGTAAGFAAAALAALAVAAFFGMPRPVAALAAVGVGPAGLAGDLLESWVKRRAGAKD